MADEQTFEVDVAAERLDRVQRDLTRILIHQNRKVRGRVLAMGIPGSREWLARFALLLCGLGGILSLAMSVARPSPQPVAMLGVFGLLGATFWWRHPLQDWLQDRVDGLVANNARRMVEPLRRVVPLSLHYALVEDALHTTCEAPPIARVTPRDDVVRAVRTELVLCVFGSERAQRVRSVVHLRDAEHAEAMDAWLGPRVEVLPP